MTQTAEPHPYPSLPPSIGFQTSGEFASVSEVGFAASIDASDVLALSGERSGEAVFEFTAEGCVLTLRQLSDTDVGLQFRPMTR